MEIHGCQVRSGAAVDTETCEGCEVCLDRCQVKAIHMADELAVITLEKCIGCGLCVSTCPTEAISMMRKDPNALSHIYADDFALALARSEDTGKAFPFE
jgi:ferredoxin